MYSVVLMMALTSGAEAPAGLFKHGCCGGCTGYSSCYGSCYGGCYGGCHGRRHRHHGCHGCYGSCSGYCTGYVYTSCCGTVVTACQGGYAAPVMPPGPGEMGTDPKLKPKPKPVEKVKPPEEGSIPGPATILVSLPADAKLFFNGTKTVSTSANRTFVSPALQPGKVYSYTLQAEVVRDGKVVTMAKKVEVRAGEATEVSFEVSAETVASK
jgi:uncharacterized protein (TIGR03000 family)